MPVQINEVVIRATVDPAQEESASATGPNLSTRPYETDTLEISEIVLEILKAKNER